MAYLIHECYRLMSIPRSIPEHCPYVNEPQVERLFCPVQPYDAYGSLITKKHPEWKRGACPVGGTGRCAIAPKAGGERDLRIGLAIVRRTVTPASFLTTSTLPEVRQMQLRKVRISKHCEDVPFVGLMTKDKFTKDNIRLERS